VTALDALPDKGWRDSLRTVARAHRRIMKAHPNAVAHLNNRPGKSVESMRFVERMLDVLRRQGFGPLLASQAIEALRAYIVGSVSAEVARANRSEPLDEVLDRLPLDEFPRVHEVAPLFHGAGASADEQFEFGLEALLDGIGVRLAADAQAVEPV
jgi:Tetracyclin repressor-like, C-terminal domain